MTVPKLSVSKLFSSVSDSSSTFGVVMLRWPRVCVRRDTGISIACYRVGRSPRKTTRLCLVSGHRDAVVTADVRAAGAASVCIHTAAEERGKAL